MVANKSSYHGSMYEKYFSGDESPPQERYPSFPVSSMAPVNVEGFIKVYYNNNNMENILHTYVC